MKSGKKLRMSEEYAHLEFLLAKLKVYFFIFTFYTFILFIYFFIYIKPLFRNVISQF